MSFVVGGVDRFEEEGRAGRVEDDGGRTAGRSKDQEWERVGRRLLVEEGEDCCCCWRALKTSRRPRSNSRSILGWGKRSARIQCEA